MTRSITLATPILFGFLFASLFVGSNSSAQEPKPGATIDLDFKADDLPKTLYNMATGNDTPPQMSVRLPDDYSPDKKFPLVVYVPGLHGGPKGNLSNAETIAGRKGWIAASLPLFKKGMDRDEVVGGILVGFEDYPTIAKAYETMLGKLFKTVPNVDCQKSAMVGFSNGSLTLGVLISNHNEFILTHFKNFCLVDHGMFHLSDLQKKNAKDCRFLILVGDREDMGREVKIKQSEIQQEAWKLLDVDLKYHVMKNTGHEFQDRHMEMVGRWIRGEDLGD